MRRVLTLLPCLALAVATAAWAVTEAELEATADALRADVEALDVEVDACPDGTCPEAAALLAEFDVLDAERLQAHADRAALDPCSCAQVDALLGDLDDLTAVLRGTLGAWEEND